MLLDNIRLCVADFETGRVQINFICHHCSKEFDYEPEQWLMKVPAPGSIGKKYELRVWCSKKCYEEDNSND